MNRTGFSKFKRKVFLSYTFKDYEKIALVSKKLNELGFDIFTDIHSVNVGNNIVGYFNEQIEKCDCFVLVVAEKFLENSIWEYDIALKTGKTVFVFIKRELFRGDVQKRFGNRTVTLWDDENELVYCIIDEISRYGYRYPLRGISLNILWVKFLKVMAV